tara:strand:- start:605 stop:2248 length:1644 start_codon:yes stop_codon:yes gene_type:complete
MMQENDDKFVKHLPCEDCGSSDGVALYESGNTYCFVCETLTKGNQMEDSSPIRTVISNSMTKGSLSALDDRKITLDTCKTYGVNVTHNNGQVFQHIYPYHDAQGVHLGNKVRTVANKTFRSEGQMQSCTLFGQKAFGQRGKFITVCEGELDAMACYQMFGSKWPSVSVKSASSAYKDCQKSLDYLNKFDNVVVCFDNDKAGREAADKVAQLFEPNKCKIVKLTHFKDANDYLKAGNREQFTKLWWDAEEYTPAGITNLGKLGDSLYDENYCETVPFPWVGLNEKVYGMRTGELLTVTSGSGMGKSSMIRELMHHVMKSSKDNIGVLALEESIRNTAFNIMSVEANKRLYIKEIRDTLSKDKLKEWEKATIGTGRFFAFDHFGSISNDEILNRIRYMAKALDCRWIFLDHLSILVSGQEGGDERKSIDILMTKLRSLVEECQIGLLLVSHLRRTSGDKGHEDGQEISLGHLRGSQSIAHLSDGVLALERNQQDDDPTAANTTVVRVLKNRYTGDVGIATYLFYDQESGRMSEISNPFESSNEEEEAPF